MLKNIENEGENPLTIKKRRIMIYFIEATEKLMQEDGVDGLSIRKIATEAGYNSATLYNYFEDLEHLVLFASVRYLREYVVELHNTVRANMDALQIYRVIYRKFSQTSFTYPEIFHNMFFGRYSHKLNAVLKQYYDLFPGELGDQNEFVLSMLLQGNIYKRDLAYMDSLVAEGFVSEEKKVDVVQVMVRTHQSFIAEMCVAGDQIDLEQHVEDFMQLFDYIMAAAK